jgi:hypothetical protein
MLPKPGIAGLLIFIWLGQDIGLARQQPKAVGKTPGRLLWSELAPVVVDRRAKTTLPDGTRIEGDVLAVRSDALVMDVTKTSNRKAHPKGQSEIPRGSLTELALIKQKGPGKLIGGILGTVGGVALAAALIVASDGSAAVGWTSVLVVIPAVAAGGYYLGRLADRRVTRIAITPDGAPTSSGEEVLQ